MKVKTAIKIKCTLVKNGKVIEESEVKNDGCNYRCRINTSVS